MAKGPLYVAPARSGGLVQPTKPILYINRRRDLSAIAQEQDKSQQYQRVR